jgi:hypothetical protein
MLDAIQKIQLDHFALTVDKELEGEIQKIFMAYKRATSYYSHADACIDLVDCEKKSKTLGAGEIFPKKVTINDLVLASQVNISIINMAKSFYFSQRKNGQTEQSSYYAGIALNCVNSLEMQARIKLATHIRFLIDVEE